MAEEGTLGLARAHDTGGDETSKEELQRRMDEARESISQTVTEIKDTVVHQYESVKESISETLDWREQFKKRPVAWTAGAVGAGFLTGYCVTGMIKGDDDGHACYDEGYEQAQYDYPNNARRAYVAQSVATTAPVETNEDAGPGLITRIQESQAYDRVRTEASTIGGHLLDEVSRTAKDILVPAAVGWVKHWLEGLLPQKPAASQSKPREAYVGGVGQSANRSSYQPVSEGGK